MSARAPRFAVIGDPVTHSASPRLFALLSRILGIPLDYRAERVTAAELPSILDRVRGGAYQGLSVTLPHKEAVLRLADGASEAARAIGAANTVVLGEGQRLEVHNTDGVGFLRALARHGVSLAGARVLLLGAGGAAHAAAAVSRSAGASALWIANRTPARAEVLAAAFSGIAVPLTAAALHPVLSSSNVLVQATSAGLSRPSETALPAGCVLHPQLTVLDMVYQPLDTTLLKAARGAGARAIDGLWMLVYQAAEQLRLWTGADVPEEAITSLHDALARGTP